jgi:para-nitrobenzyl esterase
MSPTIAIASGSLSGVCIGEVVHYRNIPYARAARFCAPEPAAPWQGTRDASQHGPICPQLRPAIVAVIGVPSAAEQDEACLSLSVAVPADVSAPRPVMVWLHGGAYIVGASSYEWYRPDVLVREGGVVVVNVNYRLGAFGYLHMPGVAPANLGLLDQLAALRWVRENIAAFGGDPSQVTLFGESAGAHSIVALMATPDARGLFRRAIAQSPHLGVGFVSQERALHVAHTLQRCLKGGDLRRAPSADLLVAQRLMQVELAGPAGLNAAPPFGPIAGLAPLPPSPENDPCRAALHRDVDLVIGSTRDEILAYFALNPRLVALRRVPLVGARWHAALVRTWTERVFGRPVRRLADARAQAGGARIYLYEFEWAPVAAPFGSCHAIDLPFTFGSDAWRDAPMLAGTPWDVIDRLGRELRTAWTHFARTGDPNAPGTPAWPTHRPGAAPGRRFFADRPA